MTDPEVTLGLTGTDGSARVVAAVDALAGCDDELGPGARIGEYLVRRLIASGGHGSVYLAEHRILGRRVAIKVLHRKLADSPDMVARFVREAQVVNRIGHKNVVDIYDLGTLPDGRPFCVMELLAGRSLRELLRKRGRFSPAEALAYLEPVCAALQAAHDAGVVHRDVKASNIAVLAEGDPPIVKLLDFGVAKVTGPNQAGVTSVGERLGTHQIMAPEQIVGGPVDRRTDVYALGILLHQLLTGVLPFRADSAAELERQHLEDPPPRPSQLAPVPRTFDAVVACCMAKRPDRRYPCVSAFLTALRQAVAQPPLHLPEANRCATAIHVALRLEPPDEEKLAAAAQGLEQIEEALEAAGFTLALQTGTLVLAVKLLPEDPRGAIAARAESLALAQRLQVAAPQACGEGGPSVEICIHSGPVVVREGEIVGGSIFRTEPWVRAGQPFHATPQMLEGLAPPA